MLDWIVKPARGNLGESFADHAARRPGYQFCGQDIGWSTAADWDIVASHDGVVTVGFNRDYGNYILIRIDTKDGAVETLYAHLSRVDVVSGQVVSAGQQIGVMGATGNAYGIHLHHELRLNGRQVDPVPYYVTDIPRARRRHDMGVLLLHNNALPGQTNRRIAVAGLFPGNPDANFLEYSLDDQERVDQLRSQYGEALGCANDVYEWHKRVFRTPAASAGSVSVDGAKIGTEAAEAALKLFAKRLAS